MSVRTAERVKAVAGWQGKTSIADRILVRTARLVSLDRETCAEHEMWVALPDEEKQRIQLLLAERPY